MARPTITYKDELQDDFAPTRGRIRKEFIPEDYPYLPSSVWWRALSFFLYRAVAMPLAWLYLHICFGIRFRNRRALKGLKQGFFLYGNHTQTAADAFIPTFAALPRRTRIVVGADAVSIPGLRQIVAMLGGLPLPCTLHGTQAFLRALAAFTAKGEAVAIYPEAHIWPYYNGIRPFSDASFAYPWRMRIPAVGFAVTYRRRRLFPSLPPKVTVTVSAPVFPEACSSKTEMRDRIYAFLCETVKSENSYAYWQYKKKEEDAL